MVRIEVSTFDQLLAVLRERGYLPVGAVIRDGSLVIDELASVGNLARGFGDEHAPGSYTLEKREDRLLFGVVNGQQSWKKYLFSARTRLFSATRQGKGFEVDRVPLNGHHYAFIGVRPCDARAIAIQDRVFLGEYRDSSYATAREGCFILAVNCTRPAGNCFCASMGTGPKVVAGFDLSMTEILSSDEHFFVVESGSELGESVLRSVPHTPAGNDDIRKADLALEAASEQMGKSVDTDGLAGILAGNFEHQEWENVAKRCLACANCTMVCPTCFCSTVEDVTDLSGGHAERWRRWDSCYTLDFARVAGGNFRTSVKSRYRQWLTHKFSAWVSQFDTFGCVGCGRCITWCPVGIDVTEEVRTIRETRKIPEEPSTIS